MTTKKTTTTRDWLLWSLSIVYLFAFVSLFVQLPGLIGRKGILPAYLVLQKEAASLEEFLLHRPSMLNILPKIGLDLDLGLDFMCVGGALTSFASIISRDHRNSLVMALQWFFYLSLVQVGQIFLASNWDNLLLEVGFVAILLAPLGLFGLNDSQSKVVVTPTSDKSNAPLKFKFLKTAENYRLPMWYVKWTLVRLVVADAFSGVFDLFDADSRTALFYSVNSAPIRNLIDISENQVLPTPFAWMVGCLPGYLLAILTSLHILSHFPVAFCILSPWRQHRLAAFYWMIITTTLSGLLGNQGFYPLLRITLSLSLLDDDWFRIVLGRVKVSSAALHPSSSQTASQPPNGDLPGNVEPSPRPGLMSNLIRAGILLAVCYLLALFYGAPYLDSFSDGVMGVILQALVTILKVAKLACTPLLLATAIVATGSLGWQLWHAVQRQKKTLGIAPIKKAIIHLRFVLLSIITISLFVFSLVPLQWQADDPTPATPTPGLIQSAFLWSHKHYRVVNNYASLRRQGMKEEMGEGGRRGVRAMRGEIVIEGSEDKDTWKEYHLLFKPSDPSRMPAMIVGHHPRLDELLWFAAGSNYKQHTWILNLAYRLLTNQEEVLELLDENPFDPESPPNYVRVHLYSYLFNYQLNETSDWWRREWVGHYLPVLSLSDSSFARYVSKSGLIEDEEKEEDETSLGCPGNNVLASGLSFVRTCLGHSSGSVLFLCLVVLGLVLSSVDPSGSTKYYVTTGPENGQVVSNGLRHEKDRKKNVINVPVEVLK